MELEIVNGKTNQTLAKLDGLSSSTTVGDVKKQFQKIKPEYYADRQSYRLDPRGKPLKDSDLLRNYGLDKGGKLFFRDLGPQVGWTTVFLTEYAGPLFVYAGFYLRPSLIYGAEAASEPKALAVQVAFVCWTFHYAKRLLETLFVHRFSHATMPIRNIFKNSGYYWGFAAFIAYYNNHPLYTPPSHGLAQLYGGLLLFVLCEFGNFSIHLALRNLRPPGTKERRIPKPTSNPLTFLFNFVSQKELATKLHQEKQKELETQRESLRCKHEAEMIKAIKQKDLEIRKLHRDLQKCQDELKEEIAKRGLSTSARSAFELERAKLLQEIKEQTSAKKQLEDALHAAKEAEKQKNLEIRQLQEHCRLEVAKVEKEAGMEVRKLLEELKSKDHLLAQMDRNQYPDRGNALRQHLANQPVDELLNLSKDLETKETTSNNQKQESAASPTPTGLQSIGWQKKIYELEKQIRLASGLNHAFIEKNKEVTTMNSSLEGKIKNLTEENQELSCELTSAKHEMKKLNELMSGSNLESLTIQLEKLRKQIKDQEYVIAQLRFDCHEKDRQIRQKANKPKKAVRFLLPGETVPLAPGFDIDDVISDGRHSDDNSGDDNADAMSVDSSLSDVTIQSSQQSDLNLADDDQELIEPSILLESVERDYEQLMREHLTLEQSYASLIHSYSLRVEGEPPPDEWKIERESLNLAIYALEEKVRRCEENEELVRIKLEQITEEKEELEFKVLEHEECYGRIGGDGAEIDAEMLEKNQKLQSEVFQLQQKLEKYENGVKVSERDVGLQCNRISDLEEVVDAKVISPRPSGLELSTENLSRLGLSQETRKMTAEAKWSCRQQHLLVLTRQVQKQRNRDFPVIHVKRWKS